MLVEIGPPTPLPPPKKGRRKKPLPLLHIDIIIESLIPTFVDEATSHASPMATSPGLTSWCHVEDASEQHLYDPFS